MTARDPITISLLGEPVAFARSRISRGGIHYTPAEQRNTMAALRMAAQQAMEHASAAVFDEPLSLTLLSEHRIPYTWSKKKQARALLGELRPAKKPDIDNLYKLAADAFSGVVYRDDALIVEVWLRKVYGNQPKLVCTIQPIFAPAAPRPRANAAWRPGELPLVVAA